MHLGLHNLATAEDKVPDITEIVEVVPRSSVCPLQLHVGVEAVAKMAVLVPLGTPLWVSQRGRVLRKDAITVVLGDGIQECSSGGTMDAKG